MTSPVGMAAAPSIKRLLSRLGLAAACGAAYGCLVYLAAPSTLTGSAYTFAASFLVALALLVPLDARLEARIDPTDGTLRTTLQSFLAEMAMASDFPRLVRQALEIVTDELDVARASLYLEPPGGHELMLVEARGEPPSRDRIARDDALLEVVATLHVELSREALRSNPRYAGMSRQYLATFDALGADVLFPIEAEGSVVGVLALALPDRAPEFAAGDLNLLRALAAEFGVCVTRARDAERVHSEQLRLERLARGLPRSIAREVLAGRIPREGTRRRSVTLVTCRVRDLEALVERLEPGEFQQALRDYHALATDEIAAHGGAIADVRGDSLSLIFGDPEPIADQGRRAIRAAIRLAEQAHALWGPWRHEPTALPVGVGVASGPATVGFVTAGRRLHYQVLGPPKAAAARLAVRAAGGEILVTAPTLATAGTEIRTEPLTASGDPDRTLIHRVLIN